jgi:hypothetical protein
LSVNTGISIMPHRKIASKIRIAPMIAHHVAETVP